MMRSENLLRLNFESDLPLALDDQSSIKDLFSKADKIFTHKSKNIREFFNNSTNGGTYG